VEIMVTSTCVHLLKGNASAGNPVQAYLDTLSLPVVQKLKEDVDRALEQCEDSSRYMSAYRGGDKLYQRVREQCFTHGGQPLKPHKLDDLPMSKKLHLRLSLHKLHAIPIGFYYAKWSEKLRFHLSKSGGRREDKRERSLSSASRSRTPTPVPARSPSPLTMSFNVAPLSAAEADTSMDERVPVYAESKFDELRSIRAAIFNDKPDAQLMKEDKNVFWYREKRRGQWKLAKDETMMNETEWNDEYDRGQLGKLQVLEQQLETLLSEHQQSNGDGPAGQGRN
jgi:hypothetical protein